MEQIYINLQSGIYKRTMIKLQILKYKSHPYLVEKNLFYTYGKPIHFSLPHFVYVEFDNRENFEFY
jgi:hypothetical protein